MPGMKVEKGPGRVWRSALALLLLAFLAAFVLPACRIDPAQPPDRVIVQLKTIHQAEFAGFYLAQERGYYTAENLEVRLVPGERDQALAEWVVYEKSDFAVFPSESVLTSRGRGLPVTALAAIFRQSPVVYVARADSGIVRPHDFIGRTVATLDASGSQQDLELPLRIMMNRLGLSVSEMKLVAWDPEYTAFYGGKADLTSCYYSVGVMEMKQRGMKLNYIWPSEYGVYFYSDMLVTRQKLLDERPGLAERFVRATLRGWQDVVEDYRDALPVVMKYARDKDLPLQEAMLEAQVPLVHTGEDHVGWMKTEDWQAMYVTLRDNGLLQGEFDPASAFDMRFIRKVYGGGAP